MNTLLHLITGSLLLFTTICHAEICWNGNAVCLVEENGFLSIGLNSHASLATASDDELVELEETVGRMQHVFQEALGFGDFARWISLEEGDVTSYVFPAAACTEPDEVNAVYKARLTLQCLGSKSRYLEPLTHEQICRITEVAARILPYPQSPIATEEKAYLITHIHDSYDLMVDEIYKRGGKCDVPWREPPAQVYRVTTPCNAFCNPAVIQRQLVVATDLNNVLACVKPYVEHHFMVIPKRHMTTLAENSREEILDKYRLFARIDSVLRNQFHTPKVGILTRVGARSGQTQFHLHDHVLGYDANAVQPWMINWVQEVCGMPFNPPKLTEDEMKTIRDTWSPLFTEIKAVAFDFGGVVVHQRHLEAPFLFGEFNVTPQQLDEGLIEFQRLNRGQIDEQSFWEQQACHFGIELKPDFLQRWKECYRASNPPYHQTLALIHQLHEYHIMTPLLSNTIPSHAEVNHEIGLYGHFAPLLLSYEIKCSKPSQEAYQRLIDETGLSPQQIVFLDDIQENVDAAQAMGMHSILFLSPEQTTHEVSQLIPELN